jgi:hypothetical protein
MGLSQWIHNLWLAELGLELLLVAGLIFTRSWRKFPLFTTYAVFMLLGDVATYSSLHYAGVRLYVYLGNETLSVTLALALIYEIFRNLFWSHLALRKLATTAFCVVGVLLVFLGAVVLWTHSPIGAKSMVTTAMVVEEAYRILEVGLVMFLFVFAGAFGLHWRQQIFGIVLGLGVSAAIKLAAVTFGPRSFVSAGIANVTVMLAYNATLLIWLAYLLIPERVTGTDEMPKRAQLEQWNQAIMELINQ